jgi:hypothetical protein
MEPETTEATMAILVTRPIEGVGVVSVAAKCITLTEDVSEACGHFRTEGDDPAECYEARRRVRERVLGAGLKPGEYGVYTRGAVASWQVDVIIVPE